MIVRGHVKWFDTTKGYGFVVTPDSEGDILLHGNVLRVFGFTSVAEGAEKTREHIDGMRHDMQTAVEAGRDAFENERTSHHDHTVQPQA